MDDERRCFYHLHAVPHVLRWNSMPSAHNDSKKVSAGLKGSDDVRSKYCDSMTVQVSASSESFNDVHNGSKKKAGGLNGSDVSISKYCDTMIIHASTSSKSLNGAPAAPVSQTMNLTRHAKNFGATIAAPDSQTMFCILARPAINPRMPSMANGGKLVSHVPTPGAPFLGTTGAPLSQAVFGSLTSHCENSGIALMAKAGAPVAPVSQAMNLTSHAGDSVSRNMFGTLTGPAETAGMPLVANAGQAAGLALTPGAPYLVTVSWTAVGCLTSSSKNAGLSLMTNTAGAPVAPAMRTTNLASHAENSGSFVGGNSATDESLFRSSTVIPLFHACENSVGCDKCSEVVEEKSNYAMRPMCLISSGLGPLLQHRRSAVQKSMFSLLPMRELSTAASNVSNSEAEEANEITTGNSELLLEKITDAKAKFISNLQVDRLKRRYRRSVRAQFLSRCLIIPGALHHKSTEFLNFQSYLMNSRDPVYITSFELMVRKEVFKTNEEWIGFLNHLIRNRTFVIEDWQATSNVGNIETLYYDYGIKGTPEVEFLKGESDASFHEASKKANLSIVIWKGSKVIWAEVFRDVDCPTTVAAEAYAALALLFKCIDLNLMNLVFYTDCQAIQGAMSGLLTIRLGNTDNELLLLLRCIQSEFQRLIPFWKPRELNFLADDLASPSGSHSLEEALKKWSYQLSGNAVFKISQTPEANNIINNFVFREYKKAPESKYFMVVDHHKKMDVLLQIIETLCPRSLCVAIDRFGEKLQEFHKQMIELFGEKNISNEETYTLVRTMTVNSDTSKDLLVVLDGTVPEKRYRHLDTFTIILVAPAQQSSLPKGINELNALAYVYFRGVREVNISKKLLLKWKEWKKSTI